MQPFRKIVKKCGQIAMLRNRFRYFEQRFELTPRVFQRRFGSCFGRGNRGIRHIRQNSIRLATRSTKGVIAQPMNLRHSVQTNSSRLPSQGLNDDKSVVR